MTKVSRKEKAIHKGYSVLSVRSTLDAVMIARRIHLFPYRTQKLSSLALMILGGRPPGKVGRCRFSKKATCLYRLLFSRKRRKRDSGAEGGGESEANVAVLVKKEVHESELLFLAQRTKRDSGAEGGGESEANVAVLVKEQPM